MVARKSGRSNKRGVKRRSKGTKKITPKQTAKVVKKTLNQTTIIKRHAFQGLEQLCPYGTSPNGLFQGQTFRVFLPLALAKDTNETAASDFNNRESSRIYARNCQFKCNVQPNSKYMAPFQMRIMAGYYKGDDNDGTQGGGLTPAVLKTLYPNIQDLPYTRNDGQRDYYWKYRKTFNFCPKQLYDGVAEHMPGVTEDESQVNRSLWMPRSFSYNFRFNRIHEFETAESDTLNGWTPLIVVQCMPLEGGPTFSRPNIETDLDNNNIGSPSPLLNVSMVTYFNDCH